MNVEVRISDLLELVGRPLTLNELEEKLFLIKAEIDKINGDSATIEVSTDRTDMLSTEGLARALRGFLEIEVGAPRYTVRSSNWQAIVDPSVEKIRPYLACGIVRGLNLTSDLIAEFMQFQERLTGTFGRNRRKTSIGLYVLDQITPPIYYKTAPPKEIKFVPLEFETSVTAEEILQYHPKGQEFGPILKGHDEYPLLVDSKGKVLSLPPIINSDDLGRLVETTKNIFVEVTGTHKLTTIQSLNNMVAAIADRGGRLAAVETVYPDHSEWLPDFTLQTREVSLTFINNMLGYSLDRQTIARSLRRMRMDCTIRGDVVRVGIPRYRVDILHDVDIVEDVAIGYGFDRIEATLPETMTIGSELPMTTLNRTIRDLMVGLGYQEIVTYVLTNVSVLYEKMNLPSTAVVEVSNPKSMEYHVARNNLLPGLLSFLGENTAQELPHRVFEVGDVITVDKGAETLTRTVPHLAGANVNSHVDITSLKAEIVTLFGNLGLSVKTKPVSNPAFIKGRVASLNIEGKRRGLFGEIHPSVLRNFGLEAPCVAFELEISTDWLPSPSK